MSWHCAKCFTFFSSFSQPNTVPGEHYHHLHFIIPSWVVHEILPGAGPLLTSAPSCVHSHLLVSHLLSESPWDVESSCCSCEGDGLAVKTAQEDPHELQGESDLVVLP